MSCEGKIDGNKRPQRKAAGAKLASRPPQFCGGRQRSERYHVALAAIGHGNVRKADGAQRFAHFGAPVAHARRVVRVGGKGDQPSAQGKVPC